MRPAHGKLSTCFPLPHLADLVDGLEMWGGGGGRIDHLFD